MLRQSLPILKKRFLKIQSHPYFNHFLLISALLLIAIISIFPFFTSQQINSQDDLNFHKMRLESYYLSVLQGDLFPRIFPQAANTFGYGVDIFYPSILLLPFALFRIIGLSFVPAYFLYLGLISLVTASLAYYSIKGITKNSKIAYLFALFYTLGTYRLIDQSVRGALGEHLAFTFLPLVLLGVYNITATKEKNWLPLAFGMSFLIMSHLITAFYTALILFVFFFGQLLFRPAFLNWLVPLLKASLASLLMSLWILVPMFEQSRQIEFKFTNANLGTEAINLGFGDLIIKSLTNVSGSWGKLSPNVGILIILALLVSLVYWRKISPQAKGLFYVTLSFILLATSLFPWFFLKDTLLARIQFPWRLLIFATLSGALLLSALLKNFFQLSKVQLVYITLIVFSLTISFNSFVSQIAQQNNFTPLTDENYLSQKHAEIGHGKEYLSTTVNYDELMENGENFIFIDEQKFFDLEQKVIKKTGLLTILDLSSYLVTNQQKEVSAPLFYYVGYQAVDQEQQPIKLYEKNGLVTFKVDSKQSSISITYQKTFWQKRSLILSSLVYLILVFLTLYHKRASRH